MAQDEQASVIRAFAGSTDDCILVVADISTEGNKVTALKAKRTVEPGGASAGLGYPSHCRLPLRVLAARVSCGPRG